MKLIMNKNSEQQLELKMKNWSIYLTNFAGSAALHYVRNATKTNSPLILKKVLIGYWTSNFMEMKISLKLQTRSMQVIATKSERVQKETNPRRKNKPSNGSRRERKLR